LPIRCFNGRPLTLVKSAEAPMMAMLRGLISRAMISEREGVGVVMVA
jgi:hypothetical protein